VKLGPWTSVVLNGDRREAWKTLWISYHLGKSRQYVKGPRTSFILKGPSCLGANLE